MGRITTPLLNLIMTLITMVTNLSLSGRLYLHKSISFYVYFNHDFSFNFNNGVVQNKIISAFFRTFFIHVSDSAISINIHYFVFPGDVS
jgi:hypothetical protein